MQSFSESYSSSASLLWSNFTLLWIENNLVQSRKTSIRREIQKRKITAYNWIFPSESSRELDLSSNHLNEYDPDVNVMKRANSWYFLNCKKKAYTVIHFLFSSQSSIGLDFIVIVKNLVFKLDFIYISMNQFTWDVPCTSSISQLGWHTFGINPLGWQYSFAINLLQLEYTPDNKIKVSFFLVTYNQKTFMPLKNT